LDNCTEFAQNTGANKKQRAKFPMKINYRGHTASIYAPTGKYRYFRVAHRASGIRRIQACKDLAEAKATADRILRETASGSLASSLNQSQSRDAVAALQRLDAFHISTGRKVSLLGAVTAYAEAAIKLNGRGLDEAVTGFLGTVVSVRHKIIAEAVEEFISSRKHKTEAKAGKRAQLSKSYDGHVNSWLREFAACFPCTAACDLTKQHLNVYAETLKGFSPKTRNHRRATVKMFIRWCARQDYLPVNHRLLEADALTREVADTGEIDCFRPGELEKLLKNAPDDLRPALAIPASIAGTRSQRHLRAGGL